MSQPRCEDGKFGEEISDEDLLAEIDDDGSLSSDIEERTDLARSQVTVRLNALVDEGDVEKTWVGNTVVWHRADDDGVELTPGG